MKKEFSLIVLLIYNFALNAQIVSIPDANFKNALINSPVVDTSGNGLGDSVADTNGDGEIQVSEAEAVVGLIISYYEVSSLEGIQSFTNLEVLKSRGNFVETVDLSQNLLLEWLHLSTNPLTSIDVSNNINLKRLWVYNNELSSLDVTQNFHLESLRCYTNNLSSLNISNGNNNILENFIAYENPLLNCIEVDDIDYANNQTQWQIDDFAFYSEDCNFSITDFENQFIIIYPNPVKNSISYNASVEIESIEIYNTLGIQIRSFKVLNNDSIDISKLPSGFYFVIFSSEEKTYAKNIIKL